MDPDDPLNAARLQLEEALRWVWVGVRVRVRDGVRDGVRVTLTLTPTLILVITPSHAVARRAVSAPRVATACA